MRGVMREGLVSAVLKQMLCAHNSYVLEVMREVMRGLCTDYARGVFGGPSNSGDFGDMLKRRVLSFTEILEIRHLFLL